MNCAQMLARAASLWPDAPAISVGRRPVMNYADFGRRVTVIAAGLRDRLGLAQGARVGIVMSNRPEFLELLWAAWHAGLCAVPINSRLHRREIAYILDNAGIEAVFYSPDLAESVAGLDAEAGALRHLVETGSEAYGRLLEQSGMPMADVADTDTAWIFYTSGTTGRPKGAMLSHRNLAFMTLSYYADIDQVEAGHTMLHPAALSHGAGLYSLPHIAHGGHQVIPEAHHFDPDEIIALTRHYREVSFFAAPTMLTRLVAVAEKSGNAMSNLRTIVYGGSAMYVADLERALKVLGPKLVQIFAQGESPMTVTSLARAAHFTADGAIAGPDILGSCGVPRTLVEVRVVDEAGNVVAPGVTGEITVRSDCVMSGYWGAPEATAAALREGWLYMGDLGSLDEAGYLTIKDRSKDMIISGGSNVYPREIEEVLLRHPDVEEISVVGRPHPDWVEEVVAFVVTRSGEELPTGEMDRLCVEAIARFKRPRAYFFVPSLPKNNYGKVLKTTLREWAAAGGSTA